ncbi:MAG: DNA-processing protein DprA [Candidatus Komeilibacteria bacterium]|nr:DNA-processing protein DprA [Candidatus Komeilibacteria bacterium]
MRTPSEKLLTLSLFAGIGPRTVLQMVEAGFDGGELGDKEGVYKKILTPARYDACKGHMERFAIRDFLFFLAEQNVKFLTLFDEEYPYLLKQIYDPPPVLYYCGETDALQHPLLAVVGTRFMSGYGEMAIKKLLPPVIKAGLVIVSGLAVGIDAAAHHQAVTGGAPTVAVLGSGVDTASLYPRQNFQLAQEILSNKGLLLSEYPPLTGARGEYFPRRNRIIAGLAKATLVVEAAARSGSLITACQALEQCREILAVPGNINQVGSVGANMLLSKGAHVAQTADDILRLYNMKDTGITRPELTEDELKIVNLLCSEALSVNQLTEKLSWELTQVLKNLTALELKSVIYTAEEKYYLA